MSNSDALYGNKRVYNTGDSRLLQNFDLNGSQGAKRYDQVFDSQMSQSHEHSQEFARAYDSHLNQSDYIKRADTEPAKQSSVSFLTQKKGHMEHIRSATALEKIDEDKQIRSGSRSRKVNHHATTGPSLKNNDLEAIMSQSNKLEESVQAHGRPPQRVPGLTNFLCEQHFKKTGVFSKNEKELFKFWKSHVSIVYKIRRDQKLAQSSFNPALEITQMSATFNANPALGISFKSQGNQKENEIYEKGIFEIYKKYERLYEMDVIYTITKDLEDEKDDFKKIQTQKEFEYKSQVANSIKRSEEDEIKIMIEEYYQDLKVFQINEVKTRDEKTKEELKKGPAWHKMNTGHSYGETINPVESIDEEKKEPQKPVIKEDFDKEKEKIEKVIGSEQSFMQSLFLMAREEGMTNDPSLLFRMYKQQKEKARLGIIWARGDEDAERIIKEFFRPERFLKRLTILYGMKNRLGQIGHLSLFGFYLQLKKRQRLLNLIDWKPVKRIKQDLRKTEEKPENANNELVFHDRIYSVEEIVDEYDIFQKRQREDMKNKEQKEWDESQKKHKEKLLNQVFGKQKKKKIEEKLNSKKPEEYLQDLAKPKDKWKRGKILLELRKTFPHDIVLERMIKEEFKMNRVFKYPEEYDLYDDEEDRLCKYRGKSGIQVKEIGAGKSLREKFKVLDDKELYYLKRTIQQNRQEGREMEEFVIEEVMKYLEKKKKRLLGDNDTIRNCLSNIYHKIVEKFPKLAKEKFPHLTYGTKKNSETYKKSFPLTFKRYFFQLVKSFVKTERGMKRLRHPPPTFIVPGGKRCTMHPYECPENCQYATLNKKVLLKSSVFRRKQREPNTFRSRVWRRRDFKKALNQVLMCRSDLENCTFEPEAGSMSKNIEQTLRTNPNLRREGFLDEPDPESYFKKLGKNFETSHPEVYKAGVLKRAKLKYMQGKFEEAMNILYDGFNIDSIKKRYDPNYMKRFMAEQLLKKKNERLEKEKEEKKQSGILTRALQREQPDSQKKRPEEDYENKKLIPILREAFDLVTIMENRKKTAEKKIESIKRTQTDLKKQLRSFSTYKKSQTRVDMSKGEKILFRTIMCPLRDKCPKIKKPRWPTSNIKSITKFGEDCPFAHHPMELKFPESIIIKLGASAQMIKNIQTKIAEEKPKEVFKPSGALFDCQGCNSKSGKHLGGPCNLCRYKEMADESTMKFQDKKRKESLRRSMERRESVDLKEERKEMREIMKALDLDNNYTKKFGLLKKACVLHFYGRFNDAFDDIAKAAKIIQDQKEIEKQKQFVIEKRWKFKLGIDDGFELPIPIEQIDPSKVDEKFLKKMDMQGVSLAAVKQFIDMVSPMKNEEYSKHQYLNKCIEDFYLRCESEIENKQDTIKKMKKQVEKLDEEADLMENMATGGSPEKSPVKDFGDTTFKVKHKKVKMCPTLAEKGKCPLKKEKRCPYAHNPIELDLIPVESKMKNLNGVIQSQTMKLKNMKPLEPWKPAKSGDIEHTHLMDMTSRKRKKSDDEDEDEEDGDKRKSKSKKSIFERENIFRKPYESND